jgi:hypothetical protein
VLLGLLTLTVFASWMFLNIVLYDAIAGIWRARYGRRSMTLRIPGEKPYGETAIMAKCQYPPIRKAGNRNLIDGRHWYIVARLPRVQLSWRRTPELSPPKMRTDSVRSP